ncbi:MAG: MobA/MobL family protein, partial [Pseudomonadota bacterium]
MAIYHFSAQIVTRKEGRSAVCAAAYRHGAKMRFVREERTINYTGKHEVVGSGVMLPDHTPQWLRDGIDGRDARGASEFIWNAVEDFENRKDAQLAREIDAALPVELTREQNIEVIEAFAKRFTARGMIVDWAYHDLDHNPHVHMMMTLRPLCEEGFGAKRAPLLDQKGEIVRRIDGRGKSQVVYQHWSGDWRGKDLPEWRAGWAEVVNEALARAGHEQRIDHRNHVDRGIDLEATEHLGVHASAMKRRGKESERADLEAEKAARNAAFLDANPDHILELIADKKAVFSPEDVGQELKRYVPDEERRKWLAMKVFGSHEIVCLAEKVVDPETGACVETEKLTTREMLSVEREMADRAARLSFKRRFSVSARHIEYAISRVNEKLSRVGGCLSKEQEAAIRSVTDRGGLSAVVGLAGAGKSTLLDAARVAWEREGYRVRGVTL